MKNRISASEEKKEILSVIYSDRVQDAHSTNSGASYRRNLRLDQRPLLLVQGTPPRPATLTPEIPLKQSTSTEDWKLPCKWCLGFSTTQLRHWTGAPYREFGRWEDPNSPSRPQTHFASSLGHQDRSGVVRRLPVVWQVQCAPQLEMPALLPTGGMLPMSYTTVQHKLGFDIKFTCNKLNFV